MAEIATKWCKRCKRERPVAEFLAMPPGWKVKHCNPCASAAMRKWGAAMSAVRDVKRLAEDARE